MERNGLNFCFMLLASFFMLALNAQVKRKYVNEFMYTGVGAREIGMGKTGVASSNDVFANYWNPVGLTDIKDNLQVGFMHNFYFQNLANFDYLAISGKPTKGKAFGFSILRFGVDKIPNTLDLVRNGQVDYNRITEFSAVDYAFMPSYAQVSKRMPGTNLIFGWGTTAKIIYRKVGTFATSWGFGADAAFRLNDYNQRWGLSLVAQDITTTANNWSFNFTDNQKDIYSTLNDTLPLSTLELATPRFNVGSFYRYKSNNWRVQPEVNLSFTTDGKRNTLVSSSFLSIDVRAGVEAGYVDETKNFKVMLRAGFYNLQRQLNNKNKNSLTLAPSIGIGLQLDFLKLDYALAGLGETGTGLYSNIISVTFGINKEEKNTKKK